MYVNELVKPVLACFKDQDSRVRYYSCEALYNIVKVTRGSMLPFFNETFDALSKVYLVISVNTLFLFNSKCFGSLSFRTERAALCIFKSTFGCNVE